MFDTSSIDKERDHIQRHMSVPIDTTKMSSNELQFHYFKMYDTDDNNMLDGCELMKSVLHWHDDQTKNNTGETENQIQAFTDETLAELIDPLLIRGDLNKDGFIDYGEYQVAQIKKEPDQPTQPE
ncbi:Multiple coagulation factor deficiency protein 2 [Orchesella cincta]|uniref:Multiple coagulation factor deficiency protein 2 n=1 Tax=Orchesella cincta TaxID=48709 RepID=A0A1D2MNK5_ORCCI|nr:Multiple coagulation factor deficiency protein 2 [Orchesella cincta]